MNNRHDPVKAGQGIGAALKLPRQKEIPRKHILEGWRREGLGCI